MTDTQARICAIIAGIYRVPADNIRPETILSLGDLGVVGFLKIAVAINHAFDIALAVELIPNSWTCVGDVIDAVEQAIAERRRAA